ncbi:MAG: preprotein translocase subunit SecA [Actinomycetaceae bacterium]|nr:preprotein translocase subunit SecA [Actinomycetaceae bacterium]
MKIIDKILRAGEGRTLKKLKKITEQVNALESIMEEMSDEELKDQTRLFKERLADGETLDDILPEAFATVREASKRVLGQRHYDVQIMGGAALHFGNISEMKTGEGKTLVATLPSYLNALTGEGVHVVTVNDYLASYQSEIIGRVFEFLGMKVGCILTSQTPQERRKEYEADVTYGTNNEFGFDYLRDNMAMDVESCVQRGHNFAIVDEVDSILIDEARTPLIISGPAEGNAEEYYRQFADLALRMKRDTDYEVDEKKRTVGILEPGIDIVEDHFGIDSLYEATNNPMISYLNNAIKAKELFERDKDYIVQNGEVLIVDEHTGRVLPGRRYNEGLHQAIEAKEHVEVKAENQTLASVTLQNYFRLYKKLSGMTGTAETEAGEFASTYDLGVVPIPTHRPVQRKDLTDLVYATHAAKLKAIVADVKETHEKGQPVLIGTTSVEKSEELSLMLRRAGVPHNVLNAKEHEREANIVAEAGRLGAVTVATNMAGRGTDIMLGGNTEYRAKQAVEALGINSDENPDEYNAAWQAALAQAKEDVKQEHEDVIALGGLYVLGSERHESRRIDNQLKGRSGRQGDPGKSRFYISLEDDLMRLFASVAVSGLRAAAEAEDAPIDIKLMSKAIERAQTQREAAHAEIRKNVLKYDDVMDEQRKIVYGERREILQGKDLESTMRSFRHFVVEDVVMSHTEDGHSDDWNLESLWIDLHSYYKPSMTAAELVEDKGGIGRLERDDLIDELTRDMDYVYEDREELFGSETMREIERVVVLNALDRKWRDHLYEMDYLKEGINLRAMAQRDPLIEYKHEGYDMFQAMNDSIKSEAVQIIFRAETPQEREERLQKEMEAAQAQAQQQKQKRKVATTMAMGGPVPNLPTNEQILGISRPVNAAMTYTSAAKNSSEGTQATDANGRAVRQANSPARDGMNRQQRRAMRKQQRKNS